MISSACPENANSSAGRPPARPGVAAAARRHERAAPHEHALQVRRRDVVAERRRVDVAELVEGEGRRREGEADVRVRELAAQPIARRVDDRAVVERGRREVVDGVPARVGRAPTGRRRAARGRGRRSRSPTRPGSGPGRRRSRPAPGARPRPGRPSPRGAGGSTPRASRRGRARRPGSAQAPANGSSARCQSSACRTPSRTCSTAARVTCVGLVDSRRGLRLIVKN